MSCDFPVQTVCASDGVAGISPPKGQSEWAMQTMSLLGRRARSKEAHRGLAKCVGCSADVLTRANLLAELLAKRATMRADTLSKVTARGLHAHSTSCRTVSWYDHDDG